MYIVAVCQSSRAKERWWWWHGAYPCYSTVASCRRLGRILGRREGRWRVWRQLINAVHRRQGARAGGEPLRGSPLAHIPESDAVSQSLSHECDPPTGHLDMQHLAGTSLRTRTPPGTDWLGLCGGSALHEAALVGDARRRALQLQQQAGVLDLHQRVHVRQPRLPPTPPTPSPKHSATSHLAYIPSCTVFPPTHGLSGGGWGCDLPPSTH